MPKKLASSLTYAGRQCARIGHGKARYTSTGECVDCCAERYSAMDEKQLRRAKRFHPENRLRRHRAERDAARGRAAWATQCRRAAVRMLLAWSSAA